MTQHVAGQLDWLAGVPLRDVGLQGLVVAEPLGLLVGIDVASHPRQHGGVVDDPAFGLVEPLQVRQVQRDERLAQDVLHRMTHAEIGAERQRGQQLADPNSRRLNPLPALTSHPNMLARAPRSIPDVAGRRREPTQRGPGDR